MSPSDTRSRDHGLGRGDEELVRILEMLDEAEEWHETNCGDDDGKTNETAQAVPKPLGGGWAACQICGYRDLDLERCQACKRMVCTERCWTGFENVCWLCLPNAYKDHSGIDKKN